jgi:glycosyltransferase involved in cell wall biosynthesis
MYAPMKVLHIVKTSVGATWVLHLVRVLRKLGIGVVVALPSATEGLAPDYRDCGAEVIAADLDFPARRPWLLPVVLSRCRALVAQVKPELIHIHHVGTTVVARLALGKKSSPPRVFQVAGPLHLEHALFARLELSLSGPADWWIATCRWTQKRYVDLGISPERVFQTYAGTDVSQFHSERAGKLRKELAIDGATPLVGMVAYMYAPKPFLGQTRGVKGHEDFIAAFGLLKERRPEIRGVVIGGPWGDGAGYERTLRALAKKTCGDTLQFLGFRNDVPEIYPDLDLAVVPSLSENLGGAAEPLLSRVSVVATNVGGLPDIVRDGDTGWLVPPRDPSKLADAIEAALAQPEEARRRAARGEALVRNLLDAERTSREICFFYETILRSRGVAA